jgi:hypothetical protein
VRAAAVIAAAWLALAAFAPAPRAQESEITASSIGDDFVDLIASPFHMDEEEAWKTAGALTLIGASMLWFDAPIDRAARDYPERYPYALIHHAARPARWYGASSGHAIITAAAVTGAVGLGGWIADDDDVVTTAGIMAESVAFTMVITYVGKMIFGRSRPYTEDGPHAFDPFTPPSRDDHLSFPSGHASTAWALAAAPATRHPHWYVQVPAYTFAVSAALERVDQRKHWMSDVIAGSILGYAVSRFLAPRYAQDDDGGEAAPPTVTVTFRF